MNNRLPYKEFVSWCNERACDGCWSLQIATVCIGIMREVKKISIFKRKKYWEEHYEQQILDEIVNPINELRRKRND